MVSYRLSQFLPAAAMAASSLSRATGRGIDEVERETSSVREAGEDSEISLLSPSRTSSSFLAEPVSILSSDPVELFELEDHRLFHPMRDGDLSDLRTVRGSVSRLDASSFPQMDAAIKFAVASPHVITCVRRHTRRRVIFALGKSGRGNAPPTYRETSNIRCE